MPSESRRKNMWSPEPFTILYAGFELEVSLEGDDLDIAVYQNGKLVKTKWVPADYEDDRAYKAYSTGYDDGIGESRRKYEPAPIPASTLTDMETALKELDEEEK